MKCKSLNFESSTLEKESLEMWLRNLRQSIYPELNGWILNADINIVKEDWDKEVTLSRLEAVWTWEQRCGCKLGPAGKCKKPREMSSQSTQSKNTQSLVEPLILKTCCYRWKERYFCCFMLFSLWQFVLEALGNELEYWRIKAIIITILTARLCENRKKVFLFWERVSL